MRRLFISTDPLDNIGTRTVFEVESALAKAYIDRAKAQVSTIVLTLAAAAFIVCLVAQPAAAAGPPAYAPQPGDERLGEDVAMAAGLAAAQAQTWDKAIRYFTVAHQAAPDSAPALYNLGLAEAQVPGRELRAICWFEAYLALEPNAANAAAVRSQIGDLDGRALANAKTLMAMANTALRLLPADYQKNMARQFAAVSAHLGDDDTAISQLEIVGDTDYPGSYLLDPGFDSAPYAAKARILNWWTDKLAGQPPSSDLAALSRLADAQMRAGRRAAAITNASAALQGLGSITADSIKARDVQSKAAIASLQTTLGRLADARATLKLVSMSDQDWGSYWQLYTQAYSGLVDAYIKAGQTDDAHALVSEAFDAARAEEGRDAQEGADKAQASLHDGVLSNKITFLTELLRIDPAPGPQYQSDLLILNQKIEDMGHSSFSRKLMHERLAQAEIARGDQIGARAALIAAERDEDACGGASDYPDPNFSSADLRSMCVLGAADDYGLGRFDDLTGIWADLPDAASARSYLDRLEAEGRKNGYKPAFFARREQSYDKAVANTAKIRVLAAYRSAVSPQERAAAWDNYVQTALSTPIYEDNFVVSVARIATNYQAESGIVVVSNILLNITPLVDRRGDVLEMQTSADR